MVADGGGRRPRRAARADDGRDLRERHPLPLARQAVIVSDIGWFSELPDDVAFKVPVTAQEVEVLAAALDLLAADPGLRRAMGNAARRLAETEHRLDRVADLYAGALTEAAAPRPGRAVAV